ncbi:MAG: hypothetical protein K0U47_09140 [Epsilonproteobacteria bacterium]|nr:hypothetical protein [Campylobacterota bacterium]
MKTILLSRSDYIDSIDMISDAKSKRFGENSLAWWDKHFNWKKDKCLVLVDEKEQHLSYLFGKSDRYLEYLTIHNLFTPHIFRKLGYAKELLSQQFDLSMLLNVKRFKFCAVPGALQFYDKLGFIYWGVNTAGDYYCDLPFPKSGLKGVSTMVKNSTNEELVGNKLKTIHKRTKLNGEKMTEAENEQFDKDKNWLGKKYRHNIITEM